MFSYSVHRHAKGHVDVSHKRWSWFVGSAGHKSSICPYTKRV